MWDTQLALNLSVGQFMKNCSAPRCILQNCGANGRFIVIDKNVAIEKFQHIEIQGIGSQNDLPVLYVQENVMSLR